jgi:hypothetical protein
MLCGLLHQHGQQDQQQQLPKHQEIRVMLCLVALAPAWLQVLGVDSEQRTGAVKYEDYGWLEACVGRYL